MKSRQFFKNGEGSAGFPPSPLTIISRPVSRVLYGESRIGCTRETRVAAIHLERRLPGASSSQPE